MRASHVCAGFCLVIGVLIAGCGQGASAIGGGSGLAIPSVASEKEHAFQQVLTKGMHVEKVRLVDANVVSGSLIGWASVSGFENCPVRFTATLDGTYRADLLQKPDGSRVALNMSNPKSQDLVSFAAQHPRTAIECLGSDKAPAELPSD